MKFYREENLPAHSTLFSSVIMHHYYYCKVQMKLLRAKVACEFSVKMSKNIGMNGEVERSDGWGLNCF